MKKLYIFLIFAFLIGCTSIPQPTTSTPRQESFFDGFWEMPNGLITYIHNDVYFVDNNRTIINYGIFTYSDTWICLNWDKNASTKFEYKKDGENFIIIEADDNEFVIGIWRRNKDIILEYNDKSKIEGYWENRDGNKIRILHILPNGMGFQLTCNSDLSLDIRAIVSYEGISPTEINVTLDTEGMFPIRLPLKIIYEKNAIKAGIGNDSSNYLRYERK